MNNFPFSIPDSPTQSHYGGFPSRDSQSLDVAHHFDQIEKQFVDLHDRLGQPTSPQTQSRPTTHLTAPKAQTGRYIDLMDALTSSDRPHTTTPTSLSPPVSPFNEDVAERNMTRFLRIQYQKGYSNSRILSALYQEDVADRNIAKYSAPDRTMSGLSCRSSPPAPGRVRLPDGQKRISKKREPGKPAWTSAENLRTNPSKDDGAGTATLRPQPDLKTALRPQRSAPSLGVDEGFVAQEEAPPSPVQRLGVPPAYKSGKRWSNTPLPDSPTIPTMGDNSGAAEAPSVPSPFSSVSRKSSLTKQSHSPQPSSPSSSKRNARGLSINTQLAANGRSKIVHRAIQPPTPSSSNMKRTPSIAEVMNSPLPVSSSASSPKPSARMKPSELVDLFTKAYMSSQSSNPTYESLHDAIVREVNSHEAFKRVPVPVPGPPFTPAADKTGTVSEQATGLNRSSSTKSRLNKSFMKHKRTPEARRSISTSVGYDRLKRKVGSPARRRHTDAPLPSPGFLVDVPSKRPEVAPLPTGEPITYMDVLRASTENLPASNAVCAAPNVSRKRGRSDSASNLAIPRPAPEISLPPKTVYCMQAHSTPASMGSLDDDDDDIIHLPSLGMPPPRVQIEGVDENNIRYVIDAASPDDAQRLMYWPRRIRGGVGSNAFGSSLSPLSRARMQLRGSRSVETY